MQCSHLEKSTFNLISYTHAKVLRLHEHTAFGPVLSDGGGLLVNLSPGGLLRDPLEGVAGIRPFQLRPVDAGHRRQRGDVENVPDAVLGVLGGALRVRHRSDLPRQVGALKTGNAH